MFLCSQAVLSSLWILCVASALVKGEDVCTTPLSTEVATHGGSLLQLTRDGSLSTLGSPLLSGRTIFAPADGVPKTSVLSSAIHESDRLPSEGSNGPLVSRAEREQSLRDVVDILTAEGVSFVAAFGTCLGLVREGRLVEADDDIDLLVTAQTFHLVRPALEKRLKNIVWMDTPGTHPEHFMRASAPGWGPAEFYKISDVNSAQVHNISEEADLMCEFNDKLLISREELFPPRVIKPASMPGLHVPIPNQVERHLATYYGTDWKVPVEHSKGIPTPLLRGDRAFLDKFARLCGPDPRISSPPRNSSDLSIINKSVVNKSVVHIIHESVLNRSALLETKSTISESVVQPTSGNNASNSVPAGSLFSFFTRQVPVASLATGLPIPLVAIAWLTWKSSAAMDWRMVATPSTYDFGLVCLYCFLSAGSSLCLRQTNGSALQSTIGAVLLLYVLKAAISFGFLMIKQSMSFEDIVYILRQRESTMNTPVWFRLGLLGGFFASIDALSFLASQRLPPVSFQLLLNSRSLLVVPLQWLLLKKSISRSQLCALLLMGVGEVALALGDTSSMASDPEDGMKFADYIHGVALCFGKVALSAVALVFNEKALKEIPLTVDAQNLVIYLSGVVSLGSGVLCWFLTIAQTAPLQNIIGQMVEGILFNAWMISSVSLMAMLGITVAYLLKAYSALEKEVIASGVVALLAVGQTLTPGEQRLGFHSLQCCLIIMLGVVAFHLNWPVEETALASGQNEKPPEEVANS